MDVLSDGRLELGIGAGWDGADYERTGLRFDPPARRVDRFAEAVTIVKDFLREGEIDFKGAFYKAQQSKKSRVQSSTPSLF